MHTNIVHLVARLSRGMIARAVCAGSVALVACGTGGQSTEVETSEAQSALLAASGGDVTGAIDRKGAMDIDWGFDCDSKGSSITLSGVMLFEDLDAALIAKNNMKGRHTADAGTVEVSAGVRLADPSSITIPKQPPRGGVGGNPWIYVQATAMNGALLGAPALLGRCHGKAAKQHVDFTGISNLVMKVKPADNNTCSNSGGPTIRIDGTLETVGELNAKIWFQNQSGDAEDAAHVTTKYPADLEFFIRAEGAKATFSKSPHLGGAGGNPLLFVQLLDPILSDELLLGRCNKL
jgi:hypothetical protein